jgi:peptide chain release factor 3
VIVVIDVAKESKNKLKNWWLFVECVNIPIIVFINKLDREGNDAFDLMDEVEQKLGLNSYSFEFPYWYGL